MEWQKGQISGNIPLLSEVDVYKLKEYALEIAIDGAYLDINDTIEKANYLWKGRFSNARSFLIRINCYNKIRELSDEFSKYDAGRDWVYQHMGRTGGWSINSTKYWSQLYTQTLFHYLQQIHQYLRFTADKTMLQSSVNGKVVPKSHSKPLLPDAMTLPHITAMCCCNALGDKFPLFIILN